MPYLLWDASGLVKRYSLEVGAATVNALFAPPPPNMVLTVWSYLETYAILRRRYSAGAFDRKALTDAVTALQSEVVTGDFDLLSISDQLIFSASSLVDAHNMNSADAAILAAYLRFRSSLSRNSPTCLLVASDKRILWAAIAEGLQTLDPEGLSPTEASALLSVL